MLRQTEPRKESKGRKKERKAIEELKGRGCGVGAKLPSPSCGRIQQAGAAWQQSPALCGVRVPRGWRRLRQRAGARDAGSPNWCHPTGITWQHCVTLVSNGIL